MIRDSKIQDYIICEDLFKIYKIVLLLGKLCLLIGRKLGILCHSINLLLNIVSIVFKTIIV